jgi:hypothetical protein
MQSRTSFISRQANSRSKSWMSKGFWRRRNLLIGAAIVALSVGIVFASVPFLPSAQPPHTTVLSPRTITVDRATGSKPGHGGLTVSLSAAQNFWVEVNVTGGASSFCVIQDQPYQSWVSSYNNNYYPLTSSTCLLGPTQQEVHDILKFVSTSSGSWWVVALNNNSSPITVSFQQA